MGMQMEGTGGSQGKAIKNRCEAPTLLFPPSWLLAKNLQMAERRGEGSQIP